MIRVGETKVHGHAVVILENDVLSLTLAAGKGADLISMMDRASCTELMWRSPLGTDALKLPEDEIRYMGGWIEAFPNAWSVCTHRGRELVGYGDVWQLPWQYRLDSSHNGAIRVEFAVQSGQLPLHLAKTVILQPDSAIVRIEETVLHTGKETVDFTWGHHPNLGRPFLSEDCVIAIPPCEIWEDGRKVGDWPFLPVEGGQVDLRLVPKYGSSTENRQVCLRHLTENKAVVRNQKTGLSFRLSWDGLTFPDLLLWRAFDTTWSDLFGDNQIVCLFPKRSHGNVAEAAAHGEALTLEPGQTWHSWIEAEVRQEEGRDLNEPIHFF